MGSLTRTHDIITVLQHVLSHGVITLLAVVIAFGTPDAARYILYVWWPRVELDTNLLLATEIALASTLLILFTLLKRAWDDLHCLTSAKRASLLLTRSPRKGWLSSHRERKLVRSLPTVRNASILSLTGFETLVAPGSLLRDVFMTAVEIRVMLLHPFGEALKKRAESLSEEITLTAFQTELAASIAFLDECRKNGKSVSLKFYDDDPFWKVVVLDDSAWIQHCNNGRALKDQPEYVFGMQCAEPGLGLFVPFYTLFLNKWNEAGLWEYDFNTAELVQRDASTGSETRLRLVLPVSTTSVPQLKDVQTLPSNAQEQTAPVGDVSTIESFKLSGE